MRPEQYLRRYAEPFQSRSGTVDRSAASPDERNGTALFLDQGYYYPPHVRDEAYLDVQSPLDLLEILQDILDEGRTGQRLTRRQVIEHLDLVRNLKAELEWRRAEVERLSGELARHQANEAALMAELADRETWMTRRTTELEHHQAVQTQLENENATLRANLTELRRSTSWKVTAPLRRFGMILRAMRAPDG